MKTEITRSDLLPISVYEKERKERRKKMAALKANRRVEVGPFATFYFENYETMLHQVQEMLAIERGGDAQVEDELAAYNPLIPHGRDLVATVMFEIEDPARRARELARLGGVELRNSRRTRLSGPGTWAGAFPETPACPPCSPRSRTLRATDRAADGVARR